MDIPGFASALTTGGGLVFNGDPIGILRAFDADTGRVLWSFNTGSGMRGGIVTYAIEGEQYILVPSGWGSYAALLMPALDALCGAHASGARGTCMTARPL